MNSGFRYQPFVIIGSARTGSTMLWSYLNSHPDILCLRGIFGSTSKINFGKYYGELPEEFHSSELVTFRNERPIEFLKDYIWKDYSNSYKAIGFKYFYDHGRHLVNFEEVLNFLIEERAIKILHLKRNNLLRALFSYKRALAQKSWSKANADFRTTISIEECKDYFQQVEENQKLIDHLFSDRALQVNYEILIKEPEFILQNILDYIGVNRETLTTETIKNKETNLSECIANFDDLRSYFIYTDYAGYFNE